MKNLKVRILFYFGGLFIMTAGIAASVRSALGVSPVSSIPYTLTCVWGLEMGLATIVFHCALVVLQLILLRKHFKLKNFLQVAVGVVFGLFTTACNNLVALLPLSDSLLVRGLLTASSVVLIAFGIFLYVPADFVPLAGEGTIAVIAELLHKQFSRVKIVFDVSMVTVSLITCLIFIHSLGSVGAGTVIAAFLVGFVLGIFEKLLGKKRDAILKK